MAFIAELRRRKVIQVAVGYLAVAWLVVQVAATILPAFDLPGWALRFIVLLFCLGFPVALLMAWTLELTPEGVKLEISTTGSKRMLATTIVLALLALGWFFFSDAMLPRPQATARAADPTAPARSEQSVAVVKPVVPASHGQSVAVLPLVNANNDPGQQFFSDGLSENLIDSLSRFDGLKVIGRMSSFRFRDSQDDSATIGRKLGVTYLLNGSVQRDGEVVRISAALTRAADGSTLWSEHYDRPYKNLFALQDEITHAVAGALHAKLLSPDEAAKQGDRPPSGNLEAYNAYLQGLKYWHDENFPKAAEHMDRAVQLDPDYAMAWAHLSGSLSTIAAFREEAPAVAREHVRRSRLAADRALQLAPALGPAHAARAYLQFYSFDQQGALAGCRRAVRLAPDDGTVLNGCGYTLAGIGKLGEAIRLREHLLSIEPLYTVNYLQYATLLAATGRLDDAEKYLRTSEEVAKPYPLEHLKLAALRGDASAALEIAEQAPPQDRSLYMTLATQIGPDRVAADKWLAGMLADKAWVESVDHDGYDNDNRYKIAQIYALRGDAGHALEWLERSLANNSSRALFLLADPFFLRFRDDPRFIALYGKLGLPPPSESDALGIDQIRTLSSSRRQAPPGA